MPFFEYAMASLTNSVVPSMVSRLGATKVSKKNIYHKWSDRKEDWEGAAVKRFGCGLFYCCG